MVGSRSITISAKGRGSLTVEAAPDARMAALLDLLARPSKGTDCGTRTCQGTNGVSQVPAKIQPALARGPLGAGARFADLGADTSAEGQEGGNAPSAVRPVTPGERGEPLPRHAVLGPGAGGSVDGDRLGSGPWGTTGSPQAVDPRGDVVSRSSEDLFGSEEVDGWGRDLRYGSRVAVQGTWPGPGYEVALMGTGSEKGSTTCTAGTGVQGQGPEVAWHMASARSEPFATGSDTAAVQRDVARTKWSKAHKAKLAKLLARNQHKREEVEEDGVVGKGPVVLGVGDVGIRILDF